MWRTTIHGCPSTKHDKKYLVLFVYSLCRFLDLRRYASRFLLRTLIALIPLTFSAKCTALISIILARSSLESSLLLANTFPAICFRRWLMAIRACSACSLACSLGNRGSSSCSSVARMLHSFCDTSCVIPLGDRVVSIQRFAEAIFSTAHVIIVRDGLRQAQPW